MAIAVVNDSGDTGSNWILWRRVWPANTVDIVVRVVSAIKVNYTVPYAVG